jgi:hypothetical protein
MSSEITSIDDARLAEYARLTAADMGATTAEAILAMRDEPAEVARELGISAIEVIAWCDRT